MAAQYTDENQILIAHSHGGVRALAYAEYLRQTNDNPNRVKAIVTVNSPIQGEHALLYGKYELQNRLKKEVNYIKGAYEAVVCPILVPLEFILNITGELHADLSFLYDSDQILDTILGNQGTEGQFIKSALNDPNLNFNPVALESLTPNSDFLRNYVVPYDKIIAKPSYWVTKISYYKTVYYIAGWRWIFPIIKQRREPVYYNYLYTPPPDVEKISHLSANIKIGHITGGGNGTTGSDIIQMADDANDDIDASTVKTICDVASKVFLGARWIYFATAATLTATISVLGYFIGYNLIKGPANDCDQASRFLGDFNNKFSEKIYLTSDHDGFVNTSSMVSPDGNNNSWLKDTKGDSIKDFPELNHQTSRTSDKVWGEGGFSSRTIGSYGAVYTLIADATDLRKATDIDSY